MNIKTFYLLIAVILFQLQNICSCFGLETIFLVYNNKEYNLIPISAKELNVDYYEPLKEIGDEQIQKFKLTADENSKLSNLAYVGDKIIYNNVELQLREDNIYQINDLDSKVQLKFMVGSYNEIIMKTALNFKILSTSIDYRNIKLDKETIKMGDEFNILDFLASTLYVKKLFNKLNGEIKFQNNEIKSPEINKNIINDEYEKFIDNLSTLDKKGIIKNLTRFVEYNVLISNKKDINSDWINPGSLYFFKESDYKGIALFYYYTLKRIDDINIKKNKSYNLFNPKSYFVITLERKNKDEADEIIKIFSNKNKSNNELNLIQNLEMQYKNVNINQELNYSKNFPAFSMPLAIYYYKPPVISKSTYLVAVSIDNKWIYTTGDKWFNPNVSTPESCCSDYSQKGCYFAFIDQDFKLLTNVPLMDKDVFWNVIYSTN